MPLAVVMGLNIVLFAVILRALLRATRGRRTGNFAKEHNQYWRELRAGCSVFAVLGLSWIFGAIIQIDGTSSLAFEYLFAIFTTLQGFAIFVFHCLMNKQLTDEFSALFKSSSSGSRSISCCRARAFSDNWAFFLHPRPWCSRRRSW